ncbi:MAG: hypothetical protein E7265_10350 [Lachnospiraceae bacterium]|nr:hypothetical protein [Lachnospiraceae bacterium]
MSTGKGQVNANTNTTPATAKKKKKSSGQDDVLSLVIFFAIIAIIVVGLAWLDRGNYKTDEYVGEEKNIDGDEDNNFDGILVVATVAGATVLIAAVGKKISNKRKKKKQERDLERQIQEMNFAKQSQVMDDDVAKIIAAGRSTINSRNYHKNYNFNRDSEPINVRSYRLDDDEFDEFTYDEMPAERSKSKIFFIVLACAVCISIGFIIAIIAF